MRGRRSATYRARCAGAPSGSLRAVLDSMHHPPSPSRCATAARPYCAVAARRPLSPPRSSRCAEHFSEFGADPPARARRDRMAARARRRARDRRSAALRRRRRATRCDARGGVLAPPTPSASRRSSATTNHDVKAVEYWLKERFAGDAGAGARRRVHPFRLHLARTSTTSSHALMLPRRARRGPAARARRADRGAARAGARARRRCRCSSRTHGQPATPDDARQGDGQRRRAARARAARAHRARARCWAR